MKILVLALLLLVPPFLLSACASKDPIVLGSIGYYQPLALHTLPKKPKQEIARICAYFSFFTHKRIYKILTLENLLKAAKQKNNQDIFYHVGVWQDSWNVAHIWGKTCLVLGTLE